MVSNHAKSEGAWPRTAQFTHISPVYAYHEATFNSLPPRKLASVIWKDLICYSNFTMQGWYISYYYCDGKWLLLAPPENLYIH